MDRHVGCALVVAAAVACARTGESTPVAAAPPAVEPEPAIGPARDPAPRPALVPGGSGFLTSRQAADGSWDDDAGTTGLVLLAFLGAGETHQSGAHRENVKNGLRYLRDRQDADGCFAPRTSATCAVDHALAALALTEAHGVKSTRALAETVRRGVAFALATRTPGGGWHRPPDAGGELDTEATAWSVMLLKSALLSEVGDAAANKAAITDALAELSRDVDPVTGRAGGDAGALRTSQALMARILGGRSPKDDDLLRKMADAVLADPPACETATDLERTYFATMAIYHFGGRRWVKWNVPMSELLRARQRLGSDDAERGSWDAAGGGTAAGRVRTTALVCLTLEVYYRIGDMEMYRHEKDKWNE